MGDVCPYSLGSAGRVCTVRCSTRLLQAACSPRAFRFSASNVSSNMVVAANSTSGSRTSAKYGCANASDSFNRLCGRERCVDGEGGKHAVRKDRRGRQARRQQRSGSHTGASVSLVFLGSHATQVRSGLALGDSGTAGRWRVRAPGRTCARRTCQGGNLRGGRRGPRRAG